MTIEEFLKTEWNATLWNGDRWLTWFEPNKSWIVLNGTDDRRKKHAALYVGASFSDALEALKDKGEA